MLGITVKQIKGPTGLKEWHVNVIRLKNGTQVASDTFVSLDAAKLWARFWEKQNQNMINEYKNRKVG